MISFQIVCAAGVLVRGFSQDLLLTVARAKDAKARFTQQLPQSNLRVQIFYPNRKRVPQADLAAAFRALANPVIADAVARRGALAAQMSPARSVARTAVICAVEGSAFAGNAECDFSQAGVVAPPDSPDLGKPLDGSEIRGKR